MKKFLKDVGPTLFMAGWAIYGAKTYFLDNPKKEK